MGTDQPQVIWESEHAEGMLFRIVRRPTLAQPRVPPARVEHVLEQSGKADVDAMGVRTWSKATPTYALTDVLMAALLRELPS